MYSDIFQGIGYAATVWLAFIAGNQIWDNVKQIRRNTKAIQYLYDKIDKDNKARHEEEKELWQANRESIERYESLESHVTTLWVDYHNRSNDPKEPGCEPKKAKLAASLKLSVRSQPKY